MPIFGQVWLWSLLAFLLGALLCWVLVVLPVRRRISALESRLAALRADAKVGAALERSRVADRSDSDPRPGEREARDEIRAETLTRAYALPGVQNPPAAPYGGVDAPAEFGAPHLSEPSASAPQPAPGDPGWFDEREEAAAAQRAHSEAYDGDEGDDEEHGTIFTRRTAPIPREEILRRGDLAAPQPEPDSDSRAAHRLGEARVDEDAEPEAAQTTFLPTILEPAEPAEPAEPEPEARHAMAAHDMFTPRSEQIQPEPAQYEAVQYESVQHEPVQYEQIQRAPALPERVRSESQLRPEQIQREQSVLPERVRPERRRSELSMSSEVSSPALSPAAAERTTVQPRVGAEITVQPEPSPSALPKRIPAKPQHRHPFGVAVSTPPQPTVAETGGDRPRSLFEPVVPAEGDQEAMPPPPSHLPAGGSPVASGNSRPSAPGPFGPGSAMPLPGGGSPAPEFTVKASVTALRYCTPDSIQFGRTVAEVWFRSAADAERVGFRPVG
jgi:hypothetical protein